MNEKQNKFFHEFFNEFFFLFRDDGVKESVWRRNARFSILNWLVYLKWEEKKVFFLWSWNVMTLLLTFYYLNVIIGCSSFVVSEMCFLISPTPLHPQNKKDI